MTELDDFGPALRSLRTGRQSRPKLTLEELEARSGIDSGNLSRYETNGAWPSRDVLSRILQALGVTFVEFAVEVERLERERPRGEAPLTAAEVAQSVESADALLRRFQALLDEGEEIAGELRKKR
jgi:transcriptional regulator with XRE-family HTH domain